MKIQSINFCKFSSIKIGGCLDVFLLEDCNQNYKDFYMIGSCNNILMGTKPPHLLKLSKKYDYIKIENNTLKIGGATPSGKIASFCKKHNIANFEFLSHLPGTLGGLVYMNAGLREYEIFNHLLFITTCGGVFEKREIAHGYRFTNIKTPILEATFTLEYGYDKERLLMFKAMRHNQPSTPSAGSCFKNPKGDYAGRLIEAVGLKGYRVGDTEFSKEHANFLTNVQNATFDDAIHLIKEAQKRVYEKFGIWLECEIAVLDTRYMGKDSPLLNPYEK
ncbi:UDP-N-acetylmuramate dehydrogenase [Sulfurimonas sp.]|jgi:UDP-N-acetylmuramate dehydrogenase|uniref:UDP-N-acetylmuramate dehydrogenase n=1 Tax=Sulfurimonas sp. TaxID=2022749 RepID=UPI0025DF78BB|nr:UDP-N-acetylmuramate dehydrogenase [Sulfurimonas sp.]MCK9472206.1 UDP-N-acetylmuramate dehydrogenase [Sulfurimonas sp.]MDD3504982.1 UDP-N-acetylmuramate dehydrogenase [Sulfurimonas sp.]